MRTYSKDEVGKRGLVAATEVRNGMSALPRLEAMIGQDLLHLAGSEKILRQAPVEFRYIRTAIAGVRSTIKRTRRALDEYIKSFERSGMDETAITDAFSRLVASIDRGPAIAAQVRGRGGYLAHLKHLDRFLTRRKEAFDHCAKIVTTHAHAQDITLGEFAVLVGECLLGVPDDSQPDVQYFFVCLAGPLGLAFCAAVVVGTIILLEGEANGEDDDEDDEDDEDVLLLEDLPLPEPQ